ncbi:hypothetical protein [Aquabacterium sp.]|uniref:hypothetical protein n=1 Tax=Aquabacterium sp. TaxID=1872578 RepID=UPI0025C1F35F|nr:hypothetical protein [Aquabacterium sp.]
MSKAVGAKAVARDPAAFVVVVEQDKKSTTVGPYRQFKRADADARAWDGTAGRSAWVEPMVAPAAYLLQRAAEARA